MAEKRKIQRKKEDSASKKGNTSEGPGYRGGRGGEGDKTRKGYEDSERKRHVKKGPGRRKRGRGAKTGFESQTSSLERGGRTGLEEGESSHPFGAGERGPRRNGREAAQCWGKGEKSRS